MKTKLIIISIFLSLLVSSNTQTISPSFNQEYKPEKADSNSTAADDKYVPEASLNYLDSPLIDIVWCGEKREVVFILTEKNTVYRSADEGFTGAKLNGHLEELGKKELVGGRGNVRNFAKLTNLSLGRACYKIYSEPC